MKENLDLKEKDNKATAFLFGGILTLALGGIAIWYGYNSINKDDNQGIDLTRNLLRSTGNFLSSLNFSLDNQ